MSARAESPEDLARALQLRLGIIQPANLEDLAGKIGLSIREVDSEGFEGALIREPGRARGVVAVRRGIREIGRKRFTVAHEFGHYIMGHRGAGSVCRSENIDRMGNGRADPEVEASRFASELLMPSDKVREIVRQRSATITTAKAVSQEFSTSLTSAAFKCVSLSERPCALAVSVNKTVKWYKANALFKYMIFTGNLNRDSLARHLREGTEDREKKGTMPAHVWVDSGDPVILDEAMIEEDSILLPSYNMILTILTLVGPRR